MVRTSEGIIARNNTQILRKIDHDMLEAYLLSHLGLPYIWGGDDPILGYDCSGLAVEMLKAFGKLPPGFDDTAQGLYERFKDFRTSPKLGALIFFGDNEKSIGHVGIGLNSWQMIEAGGGGRTTKTKEKAAAQNAYVRLRPISWRKVPLVACYPFSHPLSF